jgi:glycosyltransferase involved in cell wall biosynthesis
MKILYCVRLFSGLQKSVEDESWRPTGVPTIYRMMERLARDRHDASIMLTCKDGNVTWRGTRNTAVTLTGLGAPVNVLAGVRRWTWLPRRVRGPVREFAHALAVRRTYRRERPDIVYLDHANIFVAGFLALTTRARIVLRIMGVYPVMRDALTGTSLRCRLLRWCYRRRYALVVCTQDGSGVERWLEDALHVDVPRIALLNGIDQDKAAADTGVEDMPDDATVVMFLGKLEPEKGALAFIDAFMEARRRATGRLFALIVGTGSDAAAIRHRIETDDASASVRMLDRLPHAAVLALLERVDIYVSLNRLGNLSNANLEALAAGCCMVFPAVQPDLGIDVATDRLIPANAALRISCADDTAGLADSIVALAGDPARRARMGAAAKQAGATMLTDWDTRIDAEIALLTGLAEGGDGADLVRHRLKQEAHVD